MRESVSGLCQHPRRATEGPSWGHPVLVLGAVSLFSEPFCGKLLSKVDKPVEIDL